MMKTLEFKTNVNCGGCIAKVTPFLNEAEGVASWKVDTTNPLKILTVETENLSPEDVQAILAKAGYRAETM